MSTQEKSFRGYKLEDKKRIGHKRRTSHFISHAAKQGKGLNGGCATMMRVSLCSIQRTDCCVGKHWSVT